MKATEEDAPPAPAASFQDHATEGEGDLGSDVEDLKKQAQRSRPEASANVL